VSARGALRGVDYNSPLTKYRASRVKRLAEALSESSLRLDEVVFADAYYAFYLPAPVVDEESTSALCRVLVESVLTSSVGQKVRAKTVLEPLLSTISAALFISELTKQVSLKSTLERGSGTSTRSVQEAVQRALESTSSELDRVVAVKRVIEGLEPGTLSVFSTEDYGLDLLRLARNADVEAILRALEGLSAWDLGSHRDYVASKRGEKMGFELGSDVERLAPRSLAYPDELFYVRFIQRRLLLYTKVVARRPGEIYVLVDKSGSMSGDKMLWAKAVTLALYMRALRERREFSVRFFDSQPYSLHSVKKRPRVSEVVALFEYIARVKSSGGTDITRALLTALQDISSKRSTENTIILITDGIDRVAEKPIRLMLEKTRSRLVAVMIMGDNKSLENLADEYLRVVKLDQRDILRVIRAVAWSSSAVISYE
jgi:uncharacterized protein with von Willebrand factor type A (vWA) domain